MTREEARQGLQGYSLFIADGTDLKEALNMAIEALQEVQKHEETFEWCTDCKEYDKDNYCCHRWSKMIRNTVEELKEYSGLVRCKDCKNWRESHSEDEESYCYIDGRTTDSTDYCSWGERREE